MGLVDRLPPYELGEIASLVRELKSSGADVFDLSQFNPRPILGDLSLESLVKESLKIDNHRYSSSQGIKRLREAFCEMYKKRWGAVLCPDTEVCVTMGIKDGIENTIRAIFSPGDMVLLPAPSYPNHKAAILLAGANIEQVPLIDRNGSYNDLDNNQDSFNFFFEQIDNIYEMNWPKPKGLLCSFPHNPPGYTATCAFFKRSLEKEILPCCLNSSGNLAHTNGVERGSFNSQPSSERLSRQRFCPISIFCVLIC